MTGYRSIVDVDIEMGVKMDRQLFILPAEIWEATSRDDIIKTSNDMESLGILKPPYLEFDIYSEAPQITCANWLYGDNNFDVIGEPGGRDKGYKFRYKFNEDGSYDYYMGMKDENNKIQYYSFDDDVFINAMRHYSHNACLGFEKFMGIFRSQMKVASSLMANMLIVCLATKNVKKDIQEVKRHGAKSRKKPREYRYITTIKIGKITETVRAADGDRSPVRPHLRRGHIRNQRIGEGRKDVKKVFIQPVFVNADDGWIENQRKEYRIKV